MKVLFLLSAFFPLISSSLQAEGPAAREVRSSDIRAWKPAIDRFIALQGGSLDLQADKDLLAPVITALNERGKLLLEGDPERKLSATELSVWREIRLRSAQIAHDAIAGDLEQISDALDAETLRGRVRRLAAGARLLERMRASGFYDEKTVDANYEEISREKSAARRAWLMQRIRMDSRALKGLLDNQHLDLIKTRPDLFFLKLRKAVANDHDFARAFPRLHYAFLRHSPDFEDLNATETLWLHGDLRPDNVEVLSWVRDLKVPEVKDVEDSGWAAVGVEHVRMLAGAALVGKQSAAGWKERIKTARAAFVRALDMSFHEWVESVQEEKAVFKAKEKDRDWAQNADMLIEDTSLVKALKKLAKLKSKSWRIASREGAGLSSIGVRRFMFFFGKNDERPKELRELRDSSLEAFTGSKQKLSAGQRMLKSYRDLRKVVKEKIQVFKDKQGVEWFMRRRRPVEMTLNLADPLSVARVMAGLAAHLELPEAPKELLLEAMQIVSDEIVLDSLEYLHEMRLELDRLLKANAWGASVQSGR